MPAGTSAMAQRGINRNITRAKQHAAIYCADDPTDFMELLYNPQKVEVQGSAEIGQLQPIGHSSSVIMYGGHGSPTFSLQIYLSEFGYSVFRTGVPASGGRGSVQPAMDWLTSFAFPAAQGVAGPPVIVFIPNTIRCKAVVQTWRSSAERWDLDMVLREATVQLDCIELCQEFRSRADRAQYGMRGMGSVISFAGKPGTQLQLSPMPAPKGGRPLPYTVVR